MDYSLEVSGSVGDMSHERVSATLPKECNPRHNDLLQVYDNPATPTVPTEYIVDGPSFNDNGYTVRVVLRDG